MDRLQLSHSIRGLANQSLAKLYQGTTSELNPYASNPISPLSNAQGSERSYGARLQQFQQVRQVVNGALQAPSSSVIVGR